MPPAATITLKRLLGFLMASVSCASSVLRPINAVVGLGRWEISTCKVGSLGGIRGFREAFFLKLQPHHQVYFLRR